MDSEEPRTRRFPRLLDPPAVRRLSPSRLSLAGLGVVGVLLGLVYLGFLGWNRSMQWLHGQPTYAAGFDEIQLDPPPPAWFRGGQSAFLKRVSERANRRQFSVLDSGLLADLSRAFRNDPLVKRVERIELSGPKNLVARLEYRNPVALDEFSGERRDWVAIDDEGALIDVADLEPDGRSSFHLGGEPTPLFRIIGLQPPVDPQPGKAWLKESNADTVSQNFRQPIVEPRAEEAGRIAGFLRRALISEKELRSRFDYVVLHFQGQGAIWLQCGAADNSLMIRWQPPVVNSLTETFTGKLTPSEKWEQIRAWLRKNPSPGPGPKLGLMFSPDGLVPVLPKEPKPSATAH